ncbi:unnamed protein product [Sphagnum tenellum]
MVNKATMESPFYSMFGYDPNVPLWKEADVAYRPDPVDNPGPAHKAKQQLVRKAAHQANQHHQQKALEQDAKHHRTELHIFESGDLVWVRNSVSNASNKKLDGHKWEEGVIIKQLSPVTYRVRREGRKRKREATLNVKYLKPRQDTLLLPEAEQKPEEEEAEPEPDPPRQMSDEEEEQLTSEEEEEEDDYRPPPHVRPQAGAKRQTLPRAAKRPLQEDAIAATFRQKRRRRLLELSEAELARLSEAELYAYVHGDLQLKRPDGAHKFMLQQRGQQQQLQQGEDWPDLEPGTPDQAPAAQAAPPAPPQAPPAGPSTPMQRERRHLETFNKPGRSEQQGPLTERRHGRPPVVARRQAKVGPALASPKSIFNIESVYFPEDNMANLPSPAGSPRGEQSTTMDASLQGTKKRRRARRSRRARRQRQLAKEVCSRHSKMNHRDEPRRILKADPRPEEISLHQESGQQASLSFQSSSMDHIFDGHLRLLHHPAGHLRLLAGGNGSRAGQRPRHLHASAPLRRLHLLGSTVRTLGYVHLEVEVDLAGITESFDKSKAVITQFMENRQADYTSFGTQKGATPTYTRWAEILYKAQIDALDQAAAQVDTASFLGHLEAEESEETIGGRTRRFHKRFIAPILGFFANTFFGIYTAIEMGGIKTRLSAVEKGQAQLVLAVGRLNVKVDKNTLAIQENAQAILDATAAIQGIVIHQAKDRNHGRDGAGGDPDGDAAVADSPGHPAAPSFPAPLHGSKPAEHPPDGYQVGKGHGLQAPGQDRGGRLPVRGELHHPQERLHHLHPPAHGAEGRHPQPLQAPPPSNARVGRQHDHRLPRQGHDRHRSQGEGVQGPPLIRAHRVQAHGSTSTSATTATWSSAAPRSTSRSRTWTRTCASSSSTRRRRLTSGRSAGAHRLPRPNALQVSPSDFYMITTEEEVAETNCPGETQKMFIANGVVKVSLKPGCSAATSTHIVTASLDIAVTGKTWGYDWTDAPITLLGDITVSEADYLNRIRRSKRHRHPVGRQGAPRLPDVQPHHLRLPRRRAAVGGPHRAAQGQCQTLPGRAGKGRTALRGALG